MDTNNKNWLTERLNKDNFWNMMFWLGMTINGTISALFAELIPILGGVFFFSSLAVMILLLRRFNNVTYADKEFFNSQGQKLNKYPKNLFWPIVSTVAAIALTGLFMDEFARGIPDLLAIGIINSVLFMIPILYFICINCPISILLGCQLWKHNAANFDPKAKLHNPHFHSSINSGGTSIYNNSYSSPANPRSADIISDPSYRYLASNIYNPNRFK